MFALTVGKRRVSLSGMTLAHLSAPGQAGAGLPQTCGGFVCVDSPDGATGLDVCALMADSRALGPRQPPYLPWQPGCLSNSGLSEQPGAPYMVKGGLTAPAPHPPCVQTPSGSPPPPAAGRSTRPGEDWPGRPGLLERTPTPTSVSSSPRELPFPLKNQLCAPGKRQHLRIKEDCD